MVPDFSRKWSFHMSQSSWLPCWVLGAVGACLALTCQVYTDDSVAGQAGTGQAREAAGQGGVTSFFLENKFSVSKELFSSFFSTFSLLFTTPSGPQCPLRK